MTRLSAPIYRLKREARRRAQAEGRPLHEALDAVARREGYRAWSHLVSAAPAPGPAERVLSALAPGDMLLLGARPGQGKTLLGLELAVAAARAGWRAEVFSLDYTEADFAARLGDLGLDPSVVRREVAFDLSDEICADHIAARLAPRSFAVIDYLQLLDQRRSTPPLADQVRALRRRAGETGAVVVAISQISRSFDASGAVMPTRADVRLPNPVDLAHFNRACFLHEGEIALEAA